MKFKTILFLALFWVGTLQAFADDFEDGDFWFETNGTNCTLTGYSGSGEHVEIPSTATYNLKTYKVTIIGKQAFLNCYNLVSVTIPNGVTTIGPYAFFSCASLTSATIPNSVTTIDESAFEFCHSLASVTIPNSVTTIGKDAFNGCESLTSVIIPNSVTTIGQDAFGACFNLTSVTISNRVTVLDGTFIACRSLASVTIPNSVKTIRNHAFAGCSSLASVTIPNSVTTIGYRAFAGCSSFTSITIPDSVTTIGLSAFEECSSLASVTIPKSVKTIDQRAFYYCIGLKELTVQWDVPLAMKSDPFYDGVDKAACILNVPPGTGAKYRAAPVWKDFNVTAVGTEGIDAALKVYFQGNTLYVSSPTAETIEVYSFSGTKIFSTSKDAGEATFTVPTNLKAVIVRGSSGWTWKAINN